MLDPGGDVNGTAGFVQRSSLLKRLVRPVVVIVPPVPGHDFAEMPFADDQHVVQALAA